MAKQSKKRAKKQSNIVPFKKRVKHKKTMEKLPLKKRILLDILAVAIAIILLLAGSFILFKAKAHNSGFEDKEQLITTYFAGLDKADKNVLTKCFYPTRDNVTDDIQSQIKYAEYEAKTTTWKPSEIKIEWSEMNTDKMQDTIPNIKVDEATQCIAFIPIEQPLENGITALEEDVYQFYLHKTDGKWYIAAFAQTARNVTGAIKADGTKMTDEETSEWLTSLAIEIGSDKVGYLYVDNYWSEVDDEDVAKDDQIKTYITNDYQSYLTMAVIKDTDINDFQAYSTSIIQKSSQEYGDIITTDGVIGEYKTDVQIAQNKKTGARIIVWTFKTSEDDEFTHVITLEALSDYDASTYINTFHLTKEKTGSTEE